MRDRGTYPVTASQAPPTRRSGLAARSVRESELQNPETHGHQRHDEPAQPNHQTHLHSGKAYLHVCDMGCEIINSFAKRRDVALGRKPRSDMSRNTDIWASACASGTPAWVRRLTSV